MNDFIFSLMLLGAVSSTDTSLPFWATANQWGLMPENSGALAVMQARTEFDDSRTFQWRWGTSLAANDYPNDLDPSSSPYHFMVDELYGSLKWKVFTLDLGMKHRDLDFYGSDRRLGSLSQTGGHLAECGNARTMPGYLVTLDPVAIPFTGKHVYLLGTYGDYKTIDNRYVPDALVHRMQIGFKFKTGERLSFDFLLDHYAIWGGKHPEHPATVNLDNYFRVATGRHAGADGTMSDQINVIGDHGGAELFKAEYRGDGWRAVAQHDIPYADGSGMGFQNFPDGVNTLYFGWDDKDRWISDIVYEYTYTKCQSGPYNGEKFDEEGHCLTPKGVKTTGGDNYYNNGDYKSGWTHFGRPICDPLFFPVGTHAGTWTSARVIYGCENTRFAAHHFAVSGKLFKVSPYRLMLTYSQNYGTYKIPYAGESAWDKPKHSVKETPLKQFSMAFNGSYDSVAGIKGLSIIYGLYADRGELLQDSFGATLGLRFTL